MTDPTTDDAAATPDAFTVTWTPPAAPRRRWRFEPRDDGPGWWRIEDEWTGCTWRPVGCEPVSDVAVSLPHPAP